MLLFLHEQDARLLGHVLVAVHVGEVCENRLDDELVEVVDVLRMDGVIHFPLHRLRHVDAVDEPLQDGGCKQLD